MDQFCSLVKDKYFPYSTNPKLGSIWIATLELTAHNICNLFFGYSIGGGWDVLLDVEGKEANALDEKNELLHKTINDALNKNYALNEKGDTEMIYQCNRIRTVCFMTGAVMRDKLIHHVGKQMFELLKNKKYDIGTVRHRYPVSSCYFKAIHLRHFAEY
jgi:hypothetical protein